MTKSAKVQQDDIPQEIIEQAVLHWVKLSDQASAQQVSLCQQWRQENELHEQAWLRIQALDEDFTAIPQEHKSLAMLNNQHDLSRRSALKLFALAGVTMGSASLLWQQGWLLNDAALVAGRGQINAHKLSDDAHLTLNSQTQVAINFTSQARNITLEHGEMVLDSATVAGNQLAPLIIQFAEQTLTIASNSSCKIMVSNYDTCIITIANGQALLTNSNSSLMIKKGQQWQLTAQHVWQQKQLPYQPMAWLQGLLIADNMRLDQLLAYLNRYHYAYISLNSRLAAIKVSGVYQLNNLDSALQVLTRTLPIVINSRAKLWHSVQPA